MSDKFEAARIFHKLWNQCKDGEYDKPTWIQLQRLIDTKPIEPPPPSPGRQQGEPWDHTPHNELLAMAVVHLERRVQALGSGCFSCGRAILGGEGAWVEDHRAHAGDCAADLVKKLEEDDL